MNEVIIEELLDDYIDLTVIVAAVENLVAAADVIPLERETPVRNENFYEITIPQYTLDDFQSHFRMTKHTFEIILTQLSRNRGQKIDMIPFDKKVLFTIWMLGQQESFRAAGDRFNMAKSTANVIFFEIVQLLCSIRHEVIVWPDENRRNITSRILEEKCGIPGIVGMIDGTHIVIKAPHHNANDYYNRNNVHSVILQAVCDDQRKFTDIFVGTPGRVHDARVFRISPLYTLLNNGPPTINENQHLIGDNAYPLSPFLLKPFRDNGHLTPQQVRFNTLLSSVRVLIEQSFGLLKGKFRRLKYLEMSREDMISSVVTATCVLHNLIITHENPDPVALEHVDYLIGNEEFNGDFNHNENNMRQIEGQIKRNRIAALL